MDILGANTLVTQLLDLRLDKAHDILVRCCEDDRVRQEIISYLIQSERRPYEASPPANRFGITFAPSTSTSVHNPHHVASPLPRQRLPHRPSSNAPTYPLSPATTASSVTSHSTRDESGSGEYILVPVFSGPSKGDKAIRMKTAPIKYSVIREDIVVKRKLDTAYSLIAAEEPEISVPCRTTGSLQLVSVKCCIELTWRRPDSEATHSTMFYVVPKDRLEPDMLLGLEDSGEAIQDYQNTVVAQPHVPQYSIFDTRLQSSTPPAPSYHRSAMTGDGSIRSFPRRDQEQFQSHGMVEAFMTQQQLRGTGPEGRQHQRNSPAPTVRRSHPSSTEHSLPLRTNATPAPSVRHDDPNTTRTRIRLSLVWDTTVINMWIDLNAPAEDIFRVFQEHAEKRRSIAERSLMSICLKNDKNMPDHESYDLSLDEEDLDADWETTIEWLEAHKREKSPHIYGVIQIQDG